MVTYVYIATHLSSSRVSMMYIQNLQTTVLTSETYGDH